MTAWTDLVKKVYDGHKGEPGYKLGDAMKEAKKQYKKASVEISRVTASFTETKPTKKRRGKARKTRKSKK